MQPKNGLATLELALPHTEKEKDGGKKGPLMKGLNPAPTCTFFLPVFFLLPCGVNLAKRRQHQPIYTSSSRFFCSVPSPSLALPAFPPPSTPLFFVCRLVCPCLCAWCLCCFACNGRWNNIMHSKVVQPLRLKTPASYS